MIREAKFFVRNYNTSLVKILQQFCRTRSSFTALTRTRQLSLSWVRYSILSPPAFSHLNSVRYVLILREIFKFTLSVVRLFALAGCCAKLAGSNKLATKPAQHPRQANTSISVIVTPSIPRSSKCFPLLFPNNAVPCSSLPCLPHAPPIWSSFIRSS